MVEIIHTNAPLLESVIDLAPIPDISEATIVIEDIMNATPLESVDDSEICPEILESTIVVEDNTNVIQHESVEDFKISPESPQSENLLEDSSIYPLTTRSDQEPTSPIPGKPLC